MPSSTSLARTLIFFLRNLRLVLFGVRGVLGSSPRGNLLPRHASGAVATEALPDNEQIGWATGCSERAMEGNDVALETRAVAADATVASAKLAATDVFEVPDCLVRLLRWSLGSSASRLRSDAKSGLAKGLSVLRLGEE